MFVWTVEVKGHFMLFFNFQACESKKVASVTYFKKRNVFLSLFCLSPIDLHLNSN